MGDGGSKQEIADFLYEVGHLKRTARTGWALARMTNQESVADHSFRTAVIALSMATMAGADPDRAAAIALLHDLPETRLGDVNHLTRRYLDEAKPFIRVVEDQTRNLPAELQRIIQERTRQWIEQDSAEARIARDADLIDSILHLRESLPGRRVLEDRWIQYLASSIKTPVGRQVLDQVLAADPDDWWPHAVTDS